MPTAPPPFRRLSLEEFLQLFAAFPFRRRINAVHMHHTWQPDHTQYRRDPEGAIVGMWRFHTQERGFSTIAQHITIGPDGEIWTGRNWDLAPASATGHNGNNVAGPFMFEMIGNFDTGFDTFGGAQRESALQVIAHVQKRFGLPPESLHFHNQMSTKTCPGTQIDYDEIVASVRGLHEVIATAARETHSVFGREADRSRETTRDIADIFFERPAAARALEEGELDESEMTSRQSRALSDALTSPVGGARAVARGGLSPADLEKLRRHVVNLHFGQFSDTGEFSNTQADVERIFRETIPEVTEKWPRPLRLLLYAHGGLVKESAGLFAALDQIDFWLGNQIYPVFFVWETGFTETVNDIFRGIFTGQRALFDFAPGLLNKFLESVGRPIGVRMWGRMKRSAEVTVLPGGGGLVVASETANVMKKLGEVELHAVGHSAGSIFHSYLVPALLSAGVPRVKSLHFLAPAVNIPTFRAQLAGRVGAGKGIEHLTMYTMRRSYELQDSCGPYHASLLYLVHHSFEQPDETPILGLEENLRQDPGMRDLFGLQGGAGKDADVVFSVTGESAPLRKRSESTSHGGFDNDIATMESVARSVRDSDELLRPFPRDTRDFVAEELATSNVLAAIPPAQPAVSAAAAASAGPEPAAAIPAEALGATARGRKRALCVGINAYPAPYGLNGCVADARNWGAVLNGLQFDAAFLLDGQATRENILARLSDLLRTSKSGDTVVFQYAGHGTQLKDIDGDETDGQDEALCPVNFSAGGFIVDDDLRRVFDLTPAGVNVTCFIDCCHSGTITRLVAGLSEANAGAAEVSTPRFIAATPEMQQAHEEFRRSLGARATAPLRGPDSMKEVLFSACLPSEVAYETSGNGDFTSRAAPVLRSAAGLSNDQFLERVTKAFGTPARQHPNVDYPPGWGSRPLLGAQRPAAGKPAGRGTEEPEVPADIEGCLRTIAAWLRA